MNERGLGIFVVMGGIFLFFLLIPVVLFSLSQISMIMFQIIMAFLIIAYVKGFGLEGPIMWMFSGILIYFLVWKYPTFTAQIYMLILMMGMGFTSAIIWGSSMLRGKLQSLKKK